MSTFVVPVATVKSVTKHPNADALDLIEFNEVAWRCVDKINTRKPGDLVVYIPIDSLVQVTRPEFEFLKPRAKADGTCRIRTIRLRGEISQGLILDAPKGLSMQPVQDPLYPNLEIIADVRPTEVGMDAAYHFGIVKYEPPLEAIPPMCASNYPVWCEKSDAERYQNFNRSIEPYLDDDWFLSIKIDGTSMTVFYEDERVGVCSRNWEVKENDEGANKWTEETERPKATNIYWTAARKYGLLEKVKFIAKQLHVSKFAIQGEIVGPGIQKNKLGLTEQAFKAFDMYNGDASDFLPYRHFLDLAMEYQIPTVDIIKLGPIRSYIEEEFKNIQILKNVNGTPIEGIVFVASRPQRVGTLGRLKFKYINPEYLLKYEN
jgi:RNA ligase (TIGR02306 family)